MIPARRIALCGCVIGLGLLLGACQSGGGASPNASPSAAYGVIAGGIEPCSGLPPPSPLVFAAGTVTVLSGTTEVESEHVPEGGRYRFTLTPGVYVLVGQDDRGGPQARIGVTVEAGRTITRNIPNVCK